MVTRHTCITSWLLFYLTGCHVAETSLVFIRTKCINGQVLEQLVYNDISSYDPVFECFLKYLLVKTSDG